MTHVYERGQLVIPKYLRELLKWDAGTEVMMRVESSRLVVEKRTSIANELAQFSKEANIKMDSNTDFDADYEKAMNKKLQRLGLG